MAFLIRPARRSDLLPLHQLATSLSTRGFLTLPETEESLEELIDLSENSFSGKLTHHEKGQYFFAMEDLEKRKVIGSSLIVGRHGTATSPHLFFQVDPENKTLTFCTEEIGRTELGGLILDQAYRGHPAKLGKCLSLIRLLYVQRNPEKFQERLLAELLPPFTPDGKSPFWESLGKRFTNMGYREADLRSRRDKRFVLSLFPRGPIAIDSLLPEARVSIGVVGSETQPVVKILTSVGFHYLNQTDPFDGGPHYGARQDEIRYDLIQDFFFDQREVRWLFE